MGRALRVARPAGLLVTGSAVPSTLGSARPWQRCGTLPASPSTTGFVNCFRIGRPHTPARYKYTFSTARGDTINGKRSQLASEAASKQPPQGALHAAKQKSKSSVGGVQWAERTLRFQFWGSDSRPLEMSPLWLRDSCPCPQCVDPDSGQKTFSTTDLPDDPFVEHAELGPDGSLKVVWAQDYPSGGGYHTSIFPAAEVAEWRSVDKWQRDRPASHSPEKIPWDRAMYEGLLADGRCRVSYQDWMNNEDAFWHAFNDLRQTGLIFITGVPENENEVERIAKRIGPLQHTFYGMTWDVKSKPRAENVAYTSQFLGLHQDLLYHDPVPALQLLHCLSNDCEGGESLFSHGTRAAYELKLTQPQHYEALTKLKSWFKYRKGDHHYFGSRYTIQQSPSGEPKETRWAPPFQATFQIGSKPEAIKSLLKWKRAATVFRSVIESPSNMIEVKLKPGECVIFDNRQILHGRRQFATGEGSRWLKGTYISVTTYLAAVTRLAERMKALGLDLPPQWNHWKEKQIVRDSLERRQQGVRVQKFPQSAWPAPIPKPATMPKSTKTLELAKAPGSPRAPGSPETK